jgi:hypothetical protein
VCDTETSILHTSVANAALYDTFYRTKDGHYYPAIKRLNAVRLILKLIATSLNPSCSQGCFVEVCGDSLNDLLNFLQYRCMPKPTRIQDCPPGQIPVQKALLNQVVLEAFLPLNCSDYEVAEDHFQSAYVKSLRYELDCSCCGWRNNLGQTRQTREQECEKIKSASARFELKIGQYGL